MLIKICNKLANSYEMDRCYVMLIINAEKNKKYVLNDR